jgi:hypothetical protein
MGLVLGIGAVAHSLLKRRNRIAEAPLSQRQCAHKLQRLKVPRVFRKKVADDAFCLTQITARARLGIPPCLCIGNSSK